MGLSDLEYLLFKWSPPGNHFEGSFWWKSHLKLLDLYKAMAKCKVGNGKSVNLRTDLWQDRCLQHSMPHLLSYAKKTDISVHEVVNMEFLEDLFHLPLSQQAFENSSKWKLYVKISN